MKVKCVPAIVTLSAGLVDCMISFYYHLDSFSFLKQLFIVLILFYFIGCILQWILDFGMLKMKDKEENTEEEPDTEPSDDEEVIDDEIK